MSSWVWLINKHDYGKFNLSLVRLPKRKGLLSFTVLQVFRLCGIEFVLHSLGRMFNKMVFSEIIRISCLGPLSFAGSMNCSGKIFHSPSLKLFI